MIPSSKADATYSSNLCSFVALLDEINLICFHLKKHLTIIVIFFVILANCSELADTYENLPNDEYMIRLTSMCDTVSIFCDNMQSTNQLTRAMEYITLPAGANENFAMYYRPRLQNYGTCSGPEIATPMETVAYWGQSWCVGLNLLFLSSS